MDETNDKITNEYFSLLSAAPNSITSQAGNQIQFNQFSNTSQLNQQNSSMNN